MCENLPNLAKLEYEGPFFAVKAVFSDSSGGSYSNYSCKAAARIITEYEQKLILMAGMKGSTIPGELRKRLVEKRPSELHIKIK